MGEIKVTFKGEKNTGLYAVGSPYGQTDIKIKKKVVGVIIPPSWNSVNNGWIIKMMVIKKDILEDGNDNCVWKWITFKKEFDTQELARTWVQDNIDDIVKRWELYRFEE